jgi:predicted Na+-dependent transporter
MASTRPLERVLLGLLANYVLVRVITLGLLYLFQANPMASVGFFVLAGSPCAPIGPPATTIAGGNVPLAIGMMVILAALRADERDVSLVDEGGRLERLPGLLPRMQL